MKPGTPTGIGFGLEATGIPLRVLIVEPAGRSAAALQEIGAHSNVMVQVSRDPKAAVRKLRNEDYDVIVVDLPPQHMTPAELFRSIVAIDVELALKVVFLVNDLGDPLILTFLKDAGRPYLTAPVDPTELHELVLDIGLQNQEKDE